MSNILLPSYASSTEFHFLIPCSISKLATYVCKTRYTYNLTLLSGAVISAFIVDYLGEVFYNGTNGFNSSSTMEDTVVRFSLPSAAAGVSLVALTDNMDIKLNYVAQNTSSTAATTSATASNTGGSPKTATAASLVADMNEA